MRNLPQLTNEAVERTFKLQLEQARCGKCGHPRLAHSGPDRICEVRPLNSESTEQCGCAYESRSLLDEMMENLSALGARNPGLAKLFISLIRTQSAILKNEPVAGLGSSLLFVAQALEIQMSMEEEKDADTADKR
jgi:hypothetical protein